MDCGEWRPSFWHALFVAIQALHGMNVVFAGLVLEARVHFLDLQFAVEMLGVAVVAGDAGLLAVLLMAGEAAQAFMDADGSAVVAGIHFTCGDRRVALVTECLPLIVAHGDRARSLDHFGERQLGNCDMVKFPAIKECERWAGDLLLRPGCRSVWFRFLQWQAFVVELMTGEARNSRLLRKISVF